ncbi:MAG TPA: putative glycoside hydrolase [Polyangiales bacterium]
MFEPRNTLCVGALALGLSWLSGCASSLASGSARPAAAGQAAPDEWSVAAPQPPVPSAADGGGSEGAASSAVAAEQAATEPSATPAPDVQQRVVEATAASATPQAALSTTNGAAAGASDDRYVDVVSEQGQRARGLYINAPMAQRLGPTRLIKLVKDAGLDAVVIDVKDGTGRVSYDSQIPELAGSRHIFLRDAPDYIKQLKAAGIYTIARIVCFSDPVLPRAYPDRAILENRPGHVGDIWEKNAHRNTWLDPYNEKNHELFVSIAKEVEAIGFDELQLDYIRFPVDAATKFAVFPAYTDKPRQDVLIELLRRIDEAVHIPLGVDVFGVSAFHKGDPDGLGQVIEAWAKHVEVFSPMLYVREMRQWMLQVKEGRAGVLVERGVKSMRDRLGPGPVIRPFLQAFSSGADYYNPEFIAEQIRGARSGGADGFLFWHSDSSYGMVRAGTTGPARTAMPFPIDERKQAREVEWGTAKPAGEPAAVAREPRPAKPAS